MVQINEQMERIDCMEPFECAKCGTKWRDPLQREPFSVRNLVKSLKAKVPSYEECCNNLKKVTLTRPCPNCGTLIEKRGGCNHMTCYKCKGHFCWLCDKAFGERGPFYHRDSNDAALCRQATFGKNAPVVMMVLIILIKLLSMQSVPQSVIDIRNKFYELVAVHLFG